LVREEAKPPSTVENLKMKRTDLHRSIVKLNWTKTQSAIGYNIRYGIQKINCTKLSGIRVDSLTIRSLNGLQKYYFTIDAFTRMASQKEKISSNLIN